MFGKSLICFLLLALVAVQASPRYIVEVDDLDVETFISMGEMWDKIKELMKKAKEMIEALTGDLGDIANKIKEKIKEIIGVSSSKEIVDKIIAYLKEKISDVNNKLSQCIDEQRPRINEIADETQIAAMDCVLQAQGKMDTIEAEAKAIKGQATSLLKDAAKNGAKCLLHPSTAGDCLSAIFDNLQVKGKELWKQAKGIITIGKNIITEAGTCANNVRKDAFAKVKEVYKTVVDCVGK